MSAIYAITSGEYTYTEVVCGGQGPTYGSRDFCYVRAENKKQAKVFGVRAFREMGAESVSEPDYCPFTGMKVELVADPEWLQGIVDDEEKVWDFTQATDDKMP